MTTTATKSFREVLLTQWDDLGRKVAVLAEAIPPGEYDFRPAEGVRTTADVLRHLAFWNHWLAGTLRGESPDGAANEIPKGQAPTKPKLLAALDKSLAEASAEIGRQADDLPAEAMETIAAFLAHTSEHYGQLVVHARLKGLVPPASRA